MHIEINWPFRIKRDRPPEQLKADNLWNGAPLRTFDSAVRNRVITPPRSMVTPFQRSPVWHRVAGLETWVNWYYKNPVLYSIVSILARCDANRRYVVKRRKGDKAIEPDVTRKDIPGKLYNLLKRPNCTQSQFEFTAQKKTFEELLGLSLTYGNAPIGFGPDINTIRSLWNVWPQYTSPQFTGKYFDAEKFSDIISEWVFQHGTYTKRFKPEEVMLRNKPNIDPMDGLVVGRSPWYAGVRPLSNIDMAYESRNVIMANRGFDIAVSPTVQDDSGNVPLTDPEKKEMQEAIGNYGALENQDWAWFAPFPVDITPINRDVRKLGLFDEIAYDCMILCHMAGVPEILLKMFLQGATFENQEASLRQLYQNTLIPQAADDDVELNNFLKTQDTPWEIVSTFDHIACLQKKKLEEAQANNQICTFMLNLFLIGGVTLNQWLAALDMPGVPNGDVYLPEMEPALQQFILGVLGKGAKAEAESTEDPEAPKDPEEEEKALKAKLSLFVHGKQA